MKAFIQRNKVILIGILTLALGLFLGNLIFGGKGNPVSNDEHNHATEVATDQLWTCAMHPQIRAGEPGNCPICGMELIPVQTSATTESDPQAIRMSAAAMKLASVQTMVVESDKGSVFQDVRLIGKVMADERLVYSQAVHIPGRVEELYINFTGEEVRKGQVLGLVYSPELVTAQEELFIAFKIKETQPQLYWSSREKLKNWKLTDEDIDGILSSGKAQINFPIHCEYNGIVLEKKVDLGYHVMEGQVIYRVADLSNIWVLFDLYESDIQWAKLGDNVEFTIQSLPGKTFKGKVSFIDPVINPLTRVATARVEVNNSDLSLKPEMFARGVIKSRFKSNGAPVIVPKSAVMWTGKRSVVFVKLESDVGVEFVLRKVILGPGVGDGAAGGYIIESGLQAGEEIAVNGTFSIDAAAQLAGKASMMNPDGIAGMTGGHKHGGMSMPSSSPSASEPSGTDSHAGHTPDQAAASIPDRAPDREVIEQYLLLKDALVETDLEASKKVVAVLTKSVHAQHSGSKDKALIKWSTDWLALLGQMTAAEDVESIRKTFKPLSRALIDWVEASGSQGPSLYIQHCPMADNNKGGDWLSLSKTIENPFLGAAMLTCGEVTGTIE